MSQQGIGARHVTNNAMDEQIEKTTVRADGMRKVEIFQRENKTFGFRELQFDLAENCWYPIGRYSLAIIDSFDNAIREAEGRVPWLTNSEPQE